MTDILYTPDTLCTLTLNRPKKHNAFTGEMIDSLHRALDDIQKTPAIRVVLLRGNGENFCAGADLDWMREQGEKNRKENTRDAQSFSQLFQKMIQLPQPILTITQGRVMGGGIGLVAASDVVCSTPETTFCFSEVKLGLLPATIAPYVIRKIGLSQAQRYFISAENINAQEAQHMGLVHKLLQSESALEEIQIFAKSLLENAPAAIAQVKQLTARLFPVTNATTDDTATLLAQCRASQEAKEGMAAFFEKRKPSWS